MFQVTPIAWIVMSNTRFFINNTLYDNRGYMTMKMRLRMKNISYRYNINRPKPDKDTYKMSFGIMMVICIKQHLSNIWNSANEKVKQHWAWVESAAYKETCNRPNSIFFFRV